MKEYLLICLFYVFVACGNKQKNENLIYNKNDSLNITQVKDSLIFSKEDKIIEISHYQNNVKDGFSLILNKTTHLPKYLVEYNEGKRDEIIIEFYNDGKIKSLRTADIYGDSQRIKFHQNGVIKSIGNTVKGRGDGLWYYFNNEGKQIKKVLYDEGKIKNE